MIFLINPFMTEKGTRLSKQMLQLWTNFAKYGWVLLWDDLTEHISCLVNRQQGTDSGRSQLARRHPTHPSLQPQRAVVCQLYQWWTSCVARLHQGLHSDRRSREAQQASVKKINLKTAIKVGPRFWPVEINFNNWNVCYRIVKCWSQIIQRLFRKNNCTSNKFWKWFGFESTYSFCTKCR